MKKNVIAIDLGASSGRLIGVSFADGRLTTEEVYRFPNAGIPVQGRIYTDILHIYNEILAGLAAAWKRYGVIDAIGIDAWGVDFGVLDGDLELMRDPYHYRDRQAEGMQDIADRLCGPRGLFYATGVQDMWYNTTLQLLGLARRKGSALCGDVHFLMVADLLGYFLTGEMSLEYTSFATTQLYDIKNRCLSEEILSALQITPSVFPKTEMTGTVKGYLSEEVCRLTGIPTDARIPLIHTAQHDSAAAAYAVPADSDHYVFINSGTWSIIGTILEEPLINDQIYEEMYSNEGAAFGKIKLVKSIMGMWLTQELRKAWDKRGLEIDYSFLIQAAEQAPAFSHYIDVNAAVFQAPADMQDAVNTYFASTGQEVTEDQGILYRTVIESLAFQYRKALDDLDGICGSRTDTVYFLGGAIRDPLFCRFIANATGRKLMAGPVEATAIGNALIQLKSLGCYKSNAQKQAILKGSVGLSLYEPEDPSVWDLQYQLYLSKL